MARPRSRRKRSRSKSHNVAPSNNSPDSPPKPSNEIEQPRPTPSLVSAAAYRAEFFHGPLPPPDYLRQYDEIYPGAAQKMIDAGIRQTDHRISVEREVIAEQSRRANWGVWCAFALGMTGILGGVLIALVVETEAATIAGSLLSGTFLIGLASVFIYGTNSQRRERAEKSKDNP